MLWWPSFRQSSQRALDRWEELEAQAVAPALGKMEDANDVGAPLHLLIQTLDRVPQWVLYDHAQYLIAKVLSDCPLAFARFDIPQIFHSGMFTTTTLGIQSCASSTRWA